MKTKLYRNLKPGDQFTVVDLTYPSAYGRAAAVTVTGVREAGPAWFTGKRQWEIHGTYPWWFRGPIMAYSTDRVELI
jgi:hypothetical protein